MQYVCRRISQVDAAHWCWMRRYPPYYLKRLECLEKRYIIVKALCNELLINYYSLFGADIVYISSNGGLQLLTQGWVYANRAASEMGGTFFPQ